MRSPDIIRSIGFIDNNIGISLVNYFVDISIKCIDRGGVGGKIFWCEYFHAEYDSNSFRDEVESINNVRILLGKKSARNSFSENNIFWFYPKSCNNGAILLADFKKRVKVYKKLSFFSHIVHKVHLK